MCQALSYALFSHVGPLSLTIILWGQKNYPLKCLILLIMTIYSTAQIGIISRFLILLFLPHLPSHLPILLRTEFSFESSTLELSHQVRDKGMNTGGQEHKYFAIQMLEEGLAVRDKRSNFHAKNTNCVELSNKGACLRGRGRGTNMRVIQKSPFKSEYWSFTEGRDSLCSCYHPPSASASLSCWGGRGSGVKVGPFPFRWQESSRPLPQAPLPVGKARTHRWLSLGCLQSPLNKRKRPGWKLAVARREDLPWG